MEGWKTDKIENLFFLGRGRVINDEEIKDHPGIYPVYSSQTSNNGEFGKVDFYEFEGEYITWTTDGANAGKVFYRSGKFNCTNVCGTLKPKHPQETNVKYFAYLIDRHAFRHVAVVGNNKLMNNVMGKIKITFPADVNQQSAIAAMLSKVDEAIAAVQGSIAAAERRKKSLMQNLLTGRMKPDGTLRTKDEFYLDEKFGKVPVGWEVKKVCEVFDLFPTASYSRSKLLENGNCKYIHYGDIHTKFDTFLDVSNAELPYISDDLVKNFVFLKNGDIIISDTSEDYEGVGKLVEIKNVGDNRVVSGLHTLHIRSKSDVLVNGYKGYMFNEERVRLSLLKYVTGIKVYSISKSCLARVLIPIPTKEEQEQIKSKLDSVNKMIQQKKDEIFSLEKLKKSLMQNLLTGRVRVK